MDGNSALHRSSGNVNGAANALLYAVLLTLLGLFAASALAYVGDGDLWWQRELGNFILAHHALPLTLGAATFTAPDARWLPHEWIFATLWALAGQTGTETAFRLSCALVAFAAVCVDVFRTRSAGPRARTIAIALIAAGCCPSFGLRAQVLAWPMIALVALALESGPRLRWWAVPIAIAWDNLHASGLIVPAIVLIHGCGRVFSERRPVATVGSTLALTLATTLASVATPFGLAYATFAAAWAVNPATGLIAEWQHASPANYPVFISALFIVGILLTGEFRGARLSWSQRLLGLAFLCAAVLHVRNISLLCILAGPWAATSLTAMLPRQQKPSKPMSPSDRGLVAVGAVAAIALALVGAGMSKVDPEGPAAAVAQLTARNLQSRVACEDFAWCNRFAAAPRIRVFMDGRVDAYPTRVFADYRRILAGNAADVFDRWHVDAVLARRDGALARSLRGPHWHRLRSGATQLFIRV